MRYKADISESNTPGLFGRGGGGLLMIKSDVTCPECNAGYRRIELISKLGAKGEFRCLVCDHLLEVFDGTQDVALRLTVQPQRSRNNGDKTCPDTD
jgi:hypothetical protein